MNVYSLYFLSSGIFTGQSIQCRTDHLADNVPDGCGCMAGEYDKLSEKVDLESGNVVDYQPPQPSPGYEWDPETKRWLYVRTLDDYKQDQISIINQRCSFLLANVANGYPEDEIKSWTKQETEARAYLANPNSPIPFLSALSKARGIEVTVLVNKIVSKSDAFTMASGEIIGTRQKYEDMINSATTIEEVTAVMWSS